MKRLIEICFVLCCLGFIYTYAKTDNFTEIKLFKKKSISEELETALEDNQLENFLFHSGENAICVYEGITSFEIKAHTFAIYEETVEKDIIFENILFIERGTGDIYTWGGEELEKLVLIDSFDMDEFEAADISVKNTGMDIACERTEIEMAMDKVMAVLLQNGSHGLNLLLMT